MLKKVFKLFLFIIIGFAFSANSQSSSTAPATGARADTASVNALLQKSKEQAAENPANAINLARQAKDLADKINFPTGQAYALKNIGLGYYNQGKYVEALDYWNQSLEVFEKLHDDIGVANLLNNMAAIYAERGDDEKGLEYSLRSLKLSENSGNKLRILSALNTIGTIYYNKKAVWEKAKALNYFLQALPLCEAIGNKVAFGTISENIGEIYLEKGKADSLEKGKTDSALIYFKQSLKAMGDVSNSAFAYNGIGKVYLRQGNIKEALNYHEKALEIAERLNSPPNTIRSLRGIATVYDSTHDFKNALKLDRKSVV